MFLESNIQEERHCVMWHDVISNYGFRKWYQEDITPQFVIAKTATGITKEENHLKVQQSLWRIWRLVHSNEHMLYLVANILRFLYLFRRQYLRIWSELSGFFGKQDWSYPGSKHAVQLTSLFISMVRSPFKHLF